MPSIRDVDATNASKITPFDAVLILVPSMQLVIPITCLVYFLDGTLGASSSLSTARQRCYTKAGEFWSKVNKTIFLSATPGKFELELSNPGKQRLQPIPPTAISSTDDAVREQQCPATDCRSGKPTGRALGWDLIGDLVDAQTVIRPTGITDPPVDIRPSEGQVADLVQECRTRGKRDERVLVTALTKRMAGEDNSRKFRIVYPVCFWGLTRCWYLFRY